MITIKKKTSNGNITITNFGKYYFTLNKLFDLQEDELKLFISKKSDAPEGNLRDFYQTQSNRSLITKITRFTFNIILWEVINGKSFYLPKTSKSKIFIGELNPYIAQKAFKAGRYGAMNLNKRNLKIPQIQIYFGEKNKFNCCIYANRDFYYNMAGRMRSNKKIGGKIPFRLEDIIHRIYDEFSYIEEKKIKLILDTFFRRLKIICKNCGSLLMKDNDFYVKVYYPMSVKNYIIFSKNKYNRIDKKLKEDKNKNFPKSRLCQNKNPEILLQN